MAHIGKPKSTIAIGINRSAAGEMGFRQFQLACSGGIKISSHVYSKSTGIVFAVAAFSLSPEAVFPAT